MTIRIKVILDLINKFVKTSNQLQFLSSFMLLMDSARVNLYEVHMSVLYFNKVTIQKRSLILSILRRSFVSFKSLKCFIPQRESAESRHQGVLLTVFLSQFVISQEQITCLVKILKILYPRRQVGRVYPVILYMDIFL